MKIRNGFVSNSSSSSFCVLGMEFDEEKEDDIDSNLFNKTELDLKYGISDYCDEIVIGYTPQQMKDNETLGDFKRRIVDDFKKIGMDIDVKDLKWHKDGGYDG